MKKLYLKFKNWFDNACFFHSYKVMKKIRASNVDLMQCKKCGKFK
jgi:hypothetical protein